MLVRLKFRQLLITVFLIVCIIVKGYSQNSPVQVITTVMPPYSTLLSEYYTGDLPRLSVLLLNKDFNEPFMQVHLRLTIEGQGVKMQSNPYGQYPTIDLSPGAPVTISQSELAPYFSAQNLQVSSGLSGGINPQTRLPEGYYQFCFEAIEKNTNRLVGSKQCAQAFLTLSDPPFLTLPEKGTAISSTNPLNLLFQWTPRHMANPNAYNTEYEFSLVEIWDDAIAPEAAFYTAQPVYSTTLTSPNLFYGPAEPLLITGKKYAWRVKTVVPNSVGVKEPFRNDGYSEIFWFKLQGDCPLIQNAQITINPKTNKADFAWNTNPAQVGIYHLDYRKKGDNRWTTLDAQTNKASLSGLKWDTDYEYRIGTSCVITDDFLYGNNQSFRTLKQDTAGCSPSAPPALTNREPIATLRSNDTIYASGFRMRLTRVSGSNGTFSGEGYLALLVPTTTTEVSVKAKFTNIKVNTDKQLFEGKIVSIYDATESGIANLNNLTEGGTNVGNVNTGGTSITATVNGTINPTKLATVTYVVNASNDTTFTVTMTGIDGKPLTITTNKFPAVVKDAKGDIYAIDKDGTIKQVGSQGPSQVALLSGKGPEELNHLQLEKGKVTFEAHTNQKYAFDAYKPIFDKSTLFSLEYESLNNGLYRVANKLFIKDQTDIVIARLSNLSNGINPDSVRFVTGKGVELLATKKTDATYEVNLLSGPAGDAQEIYAVYRDNKAAKANKDASVSAQSFTYSFGKLKVPTYEALNLSVVLVPVWNAELDKEAIEQKLNEVYNPIGVTWTTIEAEAFTDSTWDTNHDGKLDITGAGRNNRYSEEMKLLNEAYQPYTESNPVAPYLFVFENAPKSDERGRAVLGDMLRNKQFGYIFNENNQDVALTVAHELGHGIFHLNHTFDDQYHLNEGELSTNLMDYRSGSELVKLQWDAIYSPGLVIGAFEDEGDGEAVKAKKKDFTLYYGATKVKSDTILVLQNSAVIKVKYNSNDTTAVKMRVEFDPEKKDLPTVLYPKESMQKVSVNSEWKVTISPDFYGKYTVYVKLPKEVLVKVFYVKKHEFACLKCGRDLKLDLNKLQTIFPGNDELTQSDVNIFNNSLLKGNFITCKRMAHFFAQVKHESSNFTKLQENASYSLKGVLKTYKEKASLSLFFKQSFWNNKTYLDYFHYGVFEADSNGKYLGNSITTYKWKASAAVASDTIRIPTIFTTKTNGGYKKNSYLTVEIKSRDKKLFSYIYSNNFGNRGPATEDGWNYRGKGALHLTWRENYQKVSTKVNKIFGTSYNWEINYDEPLTDKTAAVRSAIGYFHYRLSGKISDLDINDITQVSVDVNGGDNGLPERIKAFNLTKSVFEIDQCK